MNGESKNISYVPPTDIVEMEDGVHIFMDLPGVPPEKLSIDLEEGELTIKAQSTYKAAASSGERALHTEFEKVDFQRTFTLSDMVERDKIVATFSEGVLNLFLPKSEALRPRRIEIISA